MNNTLKKIGLISVSIIGFIASYAISFYVYAISNLNVSEKTNYGDQVYNIPVSEFIYRNPIFDVLLIFSPIICLLLSFFFFYKKRKYSALIIIFLPLIINILPAILIHLEWKAGIDILAQTILDESLKNSLTN